MALSILTSKESLCQRDYLLPIDGRSLKSGLNSDFRTRTKHSSTWLEHTIENTD